TQRSSNNCQFSSASGPAGCTPSSMKFATDDGQYQSSNLTCRESGNSLTCSAGIVGGFNPLHIGPWFCKSLMDEQEDGIFLQYYKILPQSSLALVSWDPLLPDGGNSSANRFECFTKEAVIPPARLAFYLDGVELATSSNLVDWLSENSFSPQPTMYSLNKTDATVEPPVRGLS
uniref:CUB domain-containing protein n=1 Tax=Macrostomum lignano TaxID=282301 RepID=A0A1I8IDH9_9PLAT